MSFQVIVDKYYFTCNHYVYQTLLAEDLEKTTAITVVLNHIVVSHEDVPALSDRFYIALFSVLEQTHCGLVTCDCE